MISRQKTQTHIVSAPDGFYIDHRLLDLFDVLQVPAFTQWPRAPGLYYVRLDEAIDVAQGELQKDLIALRERL